MAAGDIRDHVVKVGPAALTTDATPTNLSGLSSGVIPDLSYVVVTISGHAKNVTAGSGVVKPVIFTSHFSARRYDADETLAGLTLIQSSHTTVDIDLEGFALALVVSANALIPQVTGGASKDVRWCLEARYRIYEQTVDASGGG